MTTVAIGVPSGRNSLTLAALLVPFSSVITAATGDWHAVFMLASGMAAISALMAVFVPVAFMGGIIGRFFFQFGVMVTAAVLISLFVSFTLDPMLSSVWYDPQAHGNGRFARIVNAVQDRAASIYRSILGWSLRWPKTTLLLAAAVFFGSFALPKYIGFEFVPQADLGEQVVSIETPRSA